MDHLIGRTFFFEKRCQSERKVLKATLDFNTGQFIGFVEVSSIPEHEVFEPLFELTDDRDGKLIC